MQHPIVRWSRRLGRDLQIKVAAEAPDNRVFDGANAESRWPDGVLAFSSQTDRANIQGSLLLRDLRAKRAQTAAVSTFGWAVSLAGRVHLPSRHQQNFVTYSLTIGDGFGGVLGDAPPDASYDPSSGELEAIQTLAWLAGYQHWWSPKLYSVVSYGEITQDNLGFQLPTSFRKTQYSSANVNWVPSPKWLLGMEFLYGTREDKDGETGADFRTQITGRFIF